MNPSSLVKNLLYFLRLTFKLETSLGYQLKNLIIILWEERRLSAQEWEHDDADTPHIAFIVIFAFYHLWSDVVYCTKFVCEELPTEVKEGGSKVNDFDLKITRIRIID